MLREPGPGAERIKQQIDVKKENLKFLNSFYIPLLSWPFAMSISSTPIPPFVIWSWGIWASIFLIFISLMKRRVLAKINTLIQKL
ncbi:MAG TPA: hypothetical protein VNS58_02465 [Puia sp.]|nr:hypothetical protein [Puia sp.]